MMRWILLVLVLVLAYARTAGWFGSPYRADGALLVILIVAGFTGWAFVPGKKTNQQ